MLSFEKKCDWIIEWCDRVTVWVTFWMSVWPYVMSPHDWFESNWDVGDGKSWSLMTGSWYITT